MGREKTRIRARGLTRTFDGHVVAVRDVSFDVEGGEILALVGPSGCGKTTTLRIIAGLERDYEAGEVWFNDRRMDGVPVEARNVGIVFQQYALFPNMSVFENVEFGLKVRRLPVRERQRRTCEALALMRIPDLAQRRISQISGGQKQRVALARALAIEPAVLLLDEPLTALDAKLREELRTELNRLLNELGITAIIVTHDQLEAMALAHRVAVMNNGQIVQIGTPVEIYRRPKDMFVATFVGTANLLAGTVHWRDGRPFFVPKGTAWSLRLSDDFRAADGEAVTVLVRPEDIKVCEPATASLTGIVKSVLFQGSRTRLICSLGRDVEITADVEQASDSERGKHLGLAIDPGKFFRCAPDAR